MQRLRQASSRPESFTTSASAAVRCWSATTSTRREDGARLAGATSSADMWRYAPVLPVGDERHIVSMGEGWTPLIRTRRLGTRIGAEDLWVKDEGLNPTGSFKARGLSCAISMCSELGMKKAAIPSAGNAAGAMAAYAAAAGIEAHIFMPRDVPQANYIECKAAGAHVTLVDGLISDCGRIVARAQAGRRLVRCLHAQRALSHRRQENDGLRSRRTVRLAIARRDLLSRRRGVGMIGMWKAFEEMEALGWIGAEASEDDRRAGRRLPAGGQGVRSRARDHVEMFANAVHRSRRPAGTEAARRSSHAQGHSRERRLRNRGQRRARCSTRERDSPPTKAYSPRRKAAPASRRHGS